jgi:hypothetical protein
MDYLSDLTLNIIFTFEEFLKEARKQIVGATKSQKSLAMIPNLSVNVTAKVTFITLNIASAEKNAQK